MTLYGWHPWTHYDFTYCKDPLKRNVFKLPKLRKKWKTPATNAQVAGVNGRAVVTLPPRN